jgi:diguanylate cyclase (GGDEF)-like protein/PAS domain S-box-containing protein
MGSTVVKHLRRRVSLHARLIAAVLLACMLLVGLDGWRTWQNRLRDIQEDKVETANLARSLAQHAHDAIAVADNAVFVIRNRLEAGSMSDGQIERVHASLEAEVKNIPVINGLFIFDVNGNWVASSNAVTPRQLNNSFRDYFHYHREYTDRDVHIGGPTVSRSSDRWIITISRRLDDAAGNFGGVVLATILVDRLQAFYETFNVGRRGVIGLNTTGGIVIARSPSERRITGTDASGSPIFAKFLPHAPVGSFEYISPIDGVMRIGSYHRVDSYPLVLIVSHAVDDVLADWRSDATLHLGISTTAAAILALFGLRVAGQVERRQAAERLYRLLAVNSSDAIMCVAIDGTRRYVSPAFTVLTGWTVAEAMQVRWGELVHPDDQAGVDDMHAALLAGCKQFTMDFRYLCKDGAALWVEARVSLAEGDGEMQFVAAVRDISKRKAAEEKLEVVNRILAMQATTDALTGLANRRRFDEVLDTEWRRALRNGAPLSLLLLDVDRFKLYNDRYGHQGGDVCLQAVAASVTDLVRRPGDLVARYGGEEIAVVLPDADADGAAVVAEQIRAAIEALAVEHLGNVPAEVVTASFGVATAQFQAQGTPCSAEELIAAADAALYEAKRTGRNRVLSASAVTIDPIPASPLHEEERLAALARYEAAGATRPSRSLDSVVRLTASLFNVPIALVTLVGKDGQSFVAKFGTEAESISREDSFCSYTIAGTDVFTVANACKDPRFADNPLVLGEAGIRFYAGAPLVTSLGQPIGALCIIDRVARPPMTSAEKTLLTDFAALAASYMDQRLIEAESSTPGFASGIVSPP